MKKVLIALCLAFSIVSFYACAPGSIVVSERPVEPVYARPPAPRPEYVWVGGEWEWRGGRYEYINGYWAAPKPSHSWVGGHWENRRGGWYWQKGHWR